MASTNHWSQDLVAEFDFLADQQRAAALRFESQESFEMAYLARWNVVEVIVKRHFYNTTCKSLASKLNEWQVFLENRGRKSPPPIRSFPTDPAHSKLPTSRDLDGQFSSASNLLELLDPSNKYRIKRNAIAHSAEAFARKATYEEYKNKVELATAELRQSLLQTNSSESPSR